MVTFAHPETLVGRARILVVDDHEDSRVVTRLVLEHAGYVVDEAASAGEGLALAISRAPDLAIVDIVLPGYDGLELSRRLRAHPRTCATRIIAITALAKPTLAHDASLAGCDGFLMKPISISTLRALVVSQLLGAQATKVPFARA